MKTLVTPLQALRLAFLEGEALPPGTVAEADITAAERRYIVPVIGRALHARPVSYTHLDVYKRQA